MVFDSINNKIKTKMENNGKIIALIGKIGSGKDEVGKIIQYLTSGCSDDMSYEKYQMSIIQSDWEIQKFADKLKDIVCVLIGCTRHELEGREFKEKPLSENWWRYFKIENNVKKEVSREYFLKYKNSNEHSVEFEIIKTSPRLLLQLIGTECGRNIIHPNVWVNSLFSEYKPINNEKGEIIYPKWIITDTRFINEADKAKEMGGITIKIIRDNNINNNQNISEHESETALDNYTPDYIVDNNGTISDLVEKIKKILAKENII